MTCQQTCRKSDPLVNLLAAFESMRDGGTLLCLEGPDEFKCISYGFIASGDGARRWASHGSDSAASDGDPEHTWSPIMEISISTLQLEHLIVGRRLAITAVLKKPPDELRSGSDPSYHRAALVGLVARQLEMVR